ncbi:hypothetical protein [Actinoplanes sp. GCM10030250]|uniref:hypothetical protein n=1 Tax=Actinoplanes sp. GCM10030250 TaxID=3273376 RepID=UPI003611BB70
MTRGLAVVAAVTVAGQIAMTGAAAADDKPLWEVEIAKIPTSEYTRDAQTYIGESLKALRPFVKASVAENKIDPVLADVGSRFFDGARLKSTADGKTTFGHLESLGEWLEEQQKESGKPTTDAEKAYLRAVLETSAGVRQLADAAIQDVEATIGPFRATPPPAPAPAGLSKAFADLKEAGEALRDVDEQLREADPEDAAEEAKGAWSTAFGVLADLGITYAGDHDADGVVDVVELRFGASPLLADSDGDGLTDKFEITELAGFTMPNTPDYDNDAVRDGDEDVDTDGLTNLEEQTLGTSPTNPDTDGDGLKDGAEVDNGTDPLVFDQPRGPPVPGTPDPIVPAPTLTDTDGDGLEDIFEEENGSDPALVDTDSDGLSDFAEVDQYNIDPTRPDTDGDGLRDDYEVQHGADQGVHPAIADEQVSKWSYASDFALGFFAGDFVPRDSYAWLAGNLASGGLSLIPVVGWVLGGAADLRDVIAGLIHQDWIGAGLSGVGLIPYGGDAVAIPGKAAKFVLKYLHRLDGVIRMVAKWDKIPASVKTAVFRAIMLGNYNKLIAGGLSDAMIVRLAKGSRTSLPKLAEALSDGLHRAGGAPAPWLNSGKRGEDWFAGQMRSEGRFGARPPDTRTETPDGARHPDYIEERPDGVDVAHEIKTGVPKPRSSEPDALLRQCRKDGYLLAQGLFGDYVWHFLPFSSTNPAMPDEGLGPDADLLQCLRDQKIPFQIHPPNAD